MSTIPSDWTDIQKKIKKKWDKFSDKEMNSFKENIDLLSEQIQNVYGYTKEHAQKECKEFKTSLSDFISKNESSDEVNQKLV